MEKVRNLSLRKSILLYMAVGILAGFLLGAIAGNEAGRIQEQIWWKYVDQDRYIEEFLKRDEESFDVVIPRVSNSRMSDWDARFSEWCDFLQTYGILVMCAGGIIVSTWMSFPASSSCFTSSIVLSKENPETTGSPPDGGRKDCGQ